MSSKRIEDIHTSMLDRLWSSTGLVCINPLTLDVSAESVEEENVQEEERATRVEEETREPSVQEVEENKESDFKPIVEEPYIFPTPSLRRVLPDRIRRIEKQNRIYVLPESFKLDIDPEQIPIIKSTAPQKYIEILGDLTGCSKFTSSLAEYWFLDTLANLLRRGQEDLLNKQAQAVLIQWFCEWMREIEHFDAASRERMLQRFKENMLAAARFIGEESHLPAPLEVGVYHKALDEETIQHRNTMFKDHKKSQIPIDSKMAVSFEGTTSYECLLRDLMKILHYIFDLFSTDYQYDLVRSVFTFSPEYCLLDAPYQIQTPRKMYSILKPIKSPKKKDEKPAKGTKKGVEKEPDTQEYINLMQLKAYDMQQQELEEERSREDWNRRSHILPLAFAATEEIFDKYWPPQIPSPEKTPEPVAPPVKKGKKK